MRFWHNKSIELKNRDGSFLSELVLRKDVNKENFTTALLKEVENWYYCTMKEMNIKWKRYVPFCARELKK